MISHEGAAAACSRMNDDDGRLAPPRFVYRAPIITIITARAIEEQEELYSAGRYHAVIGSMMMHILRLRHL